MLLPGTQVYGFAARPQLILAIFIFDYISRIEAKVELDLLFKLCLFGLWHLSWGHYLVVVTPFEALDEHLKDALVSGLTLGPRLNNAGGDGCSLLLLCSLVLHRYRVISFPGRIGNIGRADKGRAGVLIHIDSWPLTRHPLTPDNWHLDLLMNSVRVRLFGARCFLNISSVAGHFCSRVKRVLRARLRVIKPLWVERDVIEITVRNLFLGVRIHAKVRELRLDKNYQ